MPPISKLSPFKRHVVKWSNCTLCPLCEQRTRAVLARGTIPCDVLFIGEAPGASEDILGKPFVGPAGKLLDRIISESIPKYLCSICGGTQFESPSGPVCDKGHGGADGRPCTYAMTNLVACIPKGDDGNKTQEPPEESIHACRERLEEFIDLCNPKLVVCVGKLSAKWLSYFWHWDAPSVEIMHPAAILRGDISARALLIQRCIVALSDAVADL